MHHVWLHDILLRKDITYASAGVTTQTTVKWSTKRKKNMAISYIYTNLFPVWFTQYANKKQYKLFRIVTPNRKGNGIGPTTTLHPKKSNEAAMIRRDKHDKLVLTYMHHTATMVTSLMNMEMLRSQ
jgi:hypothetical protein